MKVHILERFDLCLKQSLDLDYWEVDPAWDGKIFKSAAQAKRPVRSGKIPLRIKNKSRTQCCIRLVTAKGRAIPAKRLSDIQRRGWF